MTNRLSNREISARVSRIAICFGLLGSVLAAPLLGQVASTPASLAADAAEAVDRIIFTPAQAARSPESGTDARERIEDVWSNDVIPPPMPPAPRPRSVKTMMAMR